MTKTRAAVLAGLLLPLAACGGGSGDDEEAATAIADSIMAEQEAGSESVFTMERSEADCIGEGFVDEVGVAQLQEYGFLSEDLEAKAMTNVTMGAEDAQAATDVLFDCADVTSLMSEALAAGGEVDEETQACLDEVITEDKLKTMFTLMFSGKQDEASQQVIGPMMECAAGGATQ